MFKGYKTVLIIQNNNVIIAPIVGMQNTCHIRLPVMPIDIIIKLRITNLCGTEKYFFSLENIIVV
jgi:hypothetical protein